MKLFKTENEKCWAKVNRLFKKIENGKYNGGLPWGVFQAVQTYSFDRAAQESFANECGEAFITGLTSLYSEGKVSSENIKDVLKNYSWPEYIDNKAVLTQHLKLLNSEGDKYSCYNKQYEYGNLFFELAHALIDKYSALYADDCDMAELPLLTYADVAYNLLARDDEHSESVFHRCKYILPRYVEQTGLYFGEAMAGHIQKVSTPLEVQLTMMIIKSAPKDMAQSFRQTLDTRINELVEIAADDATIKGSLAKSLAIIMDYDPVASYADVSVSERETVRIGAGKTLEALAVAFNNKAQKPSYMLLSDESDYQKGFSVYSSQAQPVTDLKEGFAEYQDYGAKLVKKLIASSAKAYTIN